jgi:hypothetical protein
MTARYRARVSSSQGHHVRRGAMPVVVPPPATEKHVFFAPKEPEANIENPSTHPKNIWVVVPCKGRLTFLQQTVGRMLSHPSVKVCLVDYSCPEHAGDWFERTFSKAVSEGRAVVERVPNQPLFSKTRAHNSGARRVLREGAEYICFLDADTIVEPGFFEYLLAEARPDRFLIAAKYDDGTDVPSMTGLLLVHGKAFTAVNGFDEQFQSWGGEDIELRLRLYMVGGQDFAFVPIALARPIQHDDSLRSQFYTARNIQASNQANMERLRYRMSHEWVFQSTRDPANAAPLWFVTKQKPSKPRVERRFVSQENSTALPVTAQSGRRFAARRESD